MNSLKCLVLVGCLLSIVWRETTAQTCDAVSGSSCKCEMSDGTGTFDLSPLSNDPLLTSTGFTGNGDTVHTYFFNPCGSLSFADQCAADQDAALCQSLADSEDQDYYNLGKNSQVSFRYIANTDPFQVVLRFEGGTRTDAGGSRAAEVTAMCNTDVDLLVSYNGEDGDEYSTIVYHVTVVSKWACLNHGGSSGSGSGGSSGLSGGSILLIIFFCLLITYFVAGAAFMYGKKEKRGAEMIPNLEFWKSLPGLIKDGALFVTQPCRARMGGGEGKGGEYEKL